MVTLCANFSVSNCFTTTATSVEVWNSSPSRSVCAEMRGRIDNTRLFVTAGSGIGCQSSSDMTISTRNTRNSIATAPAVSDSTLNPRSAAVRATTKNAIAHVSTTVRLSTGIQGRQSYTGVAPPRKSIILQVPDVLYRRLACMTCTHSRRNDS